jgi:hypothetical protein
MILGNNVSRNRRNFFKLVEILLPARLVMIGSRAGIESTEHLPDISISETRATQVISMTQLLLFSGDFAPR